jgi:hypothetical protein
MSTVYEETYFEDDLDVEDYMLKPKLSAKFVNV